MHDNPTESFHSEIMDIEELKTDGRKHTYCPFFHARRSKDSADLIFMPYNYLLEN